MNTRELLQDLFDRVAEDLPGVVDGLSAEDVGRRPDGRANSIGWLLWHLARVEDAQVSDVASALGLPGDQQVWLAERAGASWQQAFGLPYDPQAHGYGMSDQEVAAFQLADPSLLTSYYGEVHQSTSRLLAQLDDQQLEQVVDENYDPPVTVGVRLVSIVNDVTQHLGQAAYAKGLLDS